jgi:DNA-binding LacI/PurR family transcriptional regulator
MRTIAEQLGVTKTTVSLALRDHPSISKKTRERVVRLAHELNYRPDPAIAAIAAQRWSGESPQRHRVIAFLCHHMADRKMIQSSYLPGARRRAEELGYRLEAFYVDDYPSAEAVTRVLYNRGIRGVIVPPIQNPDSRRALKLDWSKFTSVCCGIGRVRPPLHTVATDTFLTNRLVWEAVAQAGFKRIGAAHYIHQPAADEDWQRIGATQASIRLLGLEEAARIPVHPAQVGGEEALYAWYKRYQPEVIVGFNHSVGEMLERRGVSIPKDVQFVCTITPENTRWSGIIRPNTKIATASVDVLQTELRQNHWGIPPVPSLTLIQPEWQAGETFTSLPDFEPAADLLSGHHSVSG